MDVLWNDRFIRKTCPSQFKQESILPTIQGQWKLSRSIVAASVPCKLCWYYIRFLGFCVNWLLLEFEKEILVYHQVLNIHCSAVTEGHSDETLSVDSKGIDRSSAHSRQSRQRKHNHEYCSNFFEPVPTSVIPRCKHHPQSGIENVSLPAVQFLRHVIGKLCDYNFDDASQKILILISWKFYNKGAARFSGTCDGNGRYHCSQPRGRVSSRRFSRKIWTSLKSNYWVQIMDYDVVWRLIARYVGLPHTIAVN